MYASHPRLARRFIMAFILSGCLLLPQRFLGDNVLALESFSGNAGSLNNLNGGSGWAAPWQVQNGSMTVPGYNIATAVPLRYAGTSAGEYATGGDSWQYSGRLL